MYFVHIILPHVSVTVHNRWAATVISNNHLKVCKNNPNSFQLKVCEKNTL